MIKRSRRTMAAALLTAAALVAGTTPGFAYSKQYCRDYAARAADHDPVMGALPLVVPLAVLGAGVGAIAGVAISGLAIGTGAAVGGGSGAIIGAAAGVHDRGWHRDYDQAYAECRGQ
jgi:outer membrane lipoprotein SlyB